jgi:Leucine Rich repeat
MKMAVGFACRASQCARLWIAPTARLFAQQDRMRLRRLTRFRLRTLLCVTAVVAVLAVGIRHAIDQYRIEQQVVRQLSDCRFPVAVKTRRPWWISDAIDSRFTRVFDRVVQVTIAGQTLDWDRGLALNPRNFNDEHVQILGRLRHLECLDVSSTLISAESLDELAAMRSLKALDLRGTEIDAAGISEFKQRRPDCLVCDSQPAIVAHLQSDQTITIGEERGQLQDANRLLTHARRGPDAFGYAPTLYIWADEQLVRGRAQMIRTVRRAALDAGYQIVQIQ